MEVCDSTPDLARHIARTAGMVPAVARLRRSALKKTIDVRLLHGCVCVYSIYAHSLSVPVYLSVSLSPPSLTASLSVRRSRKCPHVLQTGKDSSGRRCYCTFCIVSYCVDCNMAAFSRLEGLSLSLKPESVRLSAERM